MPDDRRQTSVNAVTGSCAFNISMLASSRRPLAEGVAEATAGVYGKSASSADEPLAVPDGVTTVPAKAGLSHTSEQSFFALGQCRQLDATGGL